MTPHLDQLDETFAAHEPLAPDADSVLAKSHEIARNLKRRQWAVRVTGGGALAAGLIAGGLTIPHALQHPGHNAQVIQEESGGGAPDPALVSSYSPDREFEAYFNAGYTYDDAVRLGRLWNQVGDQYTGKVKAEAGAELLAGQTLPIPPSGTPATPQELAMQAFWNAGYDYTDAQTLGQMWHETDLSQVKVEAGQKLEDGETLPIQPSTPKTPDSPAADSAVNAFFNAGYTYDDAVQLSKVWHTTDAYQAKVMGGNKLENGETLPIQPSS
jgi:hypothetical protein